MKKRSTELLQRILNNPNEDLNISKLLHDYNISEKTMRNDIQEIIHFLTNHNLPQAISADSKILKLYQKDNVNVIKKLISNMDLYDYKLSLEERKFYIILVLLFHEGYYSMQQLADEMYVTRNTIINDCKIVDKFLKEYDVVYSARNNKGILIKSSKVQRENLLISIFHIMIPSISYINGFFVQFIIKKFHFQYKLEDIITYMNSFTKQNNIIFAVEIFFEIAICIFVLFNCQQTQKEYCQNDMELDMIGDILCYVADALNCPLTHNEILEMEKVILMRDLKPEIQSINDFELYGVITHFLLEIGREIDIDIQNDDLLIKALLSHIKNMKNWGDVEFDITTGYGNIVLISRIQQSAQNKFYILENYLHYHMNENMKTNIIIHICAALCRNQENVMPCNVIISCPGSMATSKYLEAQICNYFNFNIVEVMTTKQVILKQNDLTSIDFIISTVAIENCSIPVVVVSPLLTFENINKIQSMALKRHKTVISLENENYPLLTQLYTVYSTGDSKKIAYLDKELKRVLKEVSRIETETVKKSALIKMLQIKYIKIVENVIDWHDAMKIASEDLVRDGYFDISYVKKAIENVEEYGSYIIVNKGIALAHANRDAGVYEDGISLLVAKDGIVFPDNEMIYLLFFFSQKGETDYIDLFREIIKLGNDYDNIKKMRDMQQESKVYQLIVEILTDYMSLEVKA